MAKPANHRRISVGDDAGPSRCTVSDISTWDLSGVASQRVRTDEGFLKAPAAIATADNVQRYYRRELGLDGDPEAIIRLFRPRAEVFAADTLASFNRCTLTVKHPKGGVSAKDWKDVAAGDVHDLKPVGDQVMSTLLIRAQDAIDVVEKHGTVQLSCGYDFDLDLTAGTAPSGEAYDGIQKNIRGNHVAIVDAARGGPGLRIADRNPEKKETIMFKIRMADVALAGLTVPGFSMTVEDAAGEAAQREVDRHSTDLAKAITAADATAAKLVVETKRADDAAVKVTELTEKSKADDAKIKELTAAASPERIEALAIERAAVVADAAILAPEYKPAGKSTQAIRTEVLTEVIAKDEALKPIATKALGANAADIAKAPVEVTAAVFSALAGHKGADATAGDDDVTRARDAALAGAKKTTKKPVLTGRAQFIARQSNGGVNPKSA